MTALTDVRPKRSDRAALYVTIIIGAAAGIWTLVQTVLRVIEIVPNRDVPVTAAFADTPATLPIGPGGEDVSVVVEQAVFHVSGMPPVTLVSLLLAQLVYAIAVVIVIVCVCLLCRNLIRGRAFDRRNLRLVGIATSTIAFGWVFSWLFSTMGANGGTAALAGAASVNSLTPMNLVPAFAIASLGAITVAFQSGHRLQRDTEGLV